MTDWMMDYFVPGFLAVVSVLALAFLVWVVVMVMHDARVRADAPCEAFRNHTYEYVPARCAAHFYGSR